MLVKVVTEGSELLLISMHQSRDDGGRGGAPCAPWPRRTGLPGEQRRLRRKTSRTLQLSRAREEDLGIDPKWA